MWLTLLDFKIGDEPLARKMDVLFLDALPTRRLLFPYTVEILTYLREKGYRLHLITNGFEKTQLSKLEHAGLSGYFAEVVTSEGAGSLKPHKEIFEYAFRRAGALPEESIMLGDSIEADIQGAINAGIDQVYVNHLRQEPALRPTYTVHTLKELENIF
jgi:putative hydrolase of the HAD superfamily